MNRFAQGLRTALILGRVSNLPTVWSNLLAGWILAGGGNDPTRLAALLAGGSFLYTGGMYLNDYCDARFDAAHRPERPIPSGHISRRAVGLAAAAYLVLGLALVTISSRSAAIPGLFLLFCIVLYDMQHKQFSLAPWLMAACRFFLYVMAAAAVGSITPQVVFPAIALACYIAGITYLAREESRPQNRSRWPLTFLLLPVVLALAQFRAIALMPLIAAASLLLLWMGWLLIPFWSGTNRSIGRIVAGLLAGIVLVDLLAVVPVLGFTSAGFLPFFAAALLLQRSIPAT